MNKVFLVTRGNVGRKVQEALEKYGKKNVLSQIWVIEENLPPILEKEDVSLPNLHDSDLILSYAFHPDISLFIIDELKSSEKVVLMPHEKAPLPPGYHVWGKLVVGVLKPCCIVPPFDSEILSAFREEFGTPSFTIQTNGITITHVTVDQHTRCGAADFVAEKLKGVPLKDAYQQAGLLAQYYCQSSQGPLGSIHDAGKVHAEAVKRALKDSEKS